MDRSNAKCWITEHRFVGQSFARMTPEEDTLNLEDEGMSLPSIILPSDHPPAWCIMLVFESLDFMLKMLKIIYSQCTVWTFPILVEAWIRYGWFKCDENVAPINCHSWIWLNLENMKIWVKYAINQISSPKIVLHDKICNVQSLQLPSFHDLVLGFCSAVSAALPGYAYSLNWCPPPIFSRHFIMSLVW